MLLQANPTNHMQIFLKLAGIVLLTLTLSRSASAAAPEWSQWRGANRDGKSAETGLLKEWPADGPRLIWKSTDLGNGYGSISASADKLFVTGDKDGDSHVIALAAADGKRLWQSKIGKAGAPGWGGFSGPRDTPTVAGAFVIAVDQWGDLVCVDAATGKEQWRKNFEKDFDGKRPEWGFSESPLVDGNQVIVTPGGSAGAIVALNLKTGETLWRTKTFTDNAQYSSAMVAAIGGARQYIQLTMENLVGVAAEDGRVLWQAKRKGATAVIPDPIVDGNRVYVSSGYGTGCNLFKVSEGSSFSAEQVYANKVMVNHHGGIVKVGDNLYGYSDGKGWTCQNFLTGEALWAEKEKLKKGSIAFADGMLYCREEAGNSKAAKGTVALLEATPKGFQEKGRFDPPDRSDKNSWAHPVIAGGKLYLRDQEVLLCYDVKSK
jgi:outer membrane protein assembly factor BamB